ncbi:uncharacterized protein LOC118116636 [Hippoglossus stenolepis]|uniref:uncharacterized protein LOC118116636 n=1 Tax=Hippoglossus stenolepis TaxID=195615 RepID=UPI001FB01516|nr:uncharacterized protein LOC118116636 [Hippoglossus stenolepis]
MSGFKSLVVLILNMWTLTTADVEVSCVLAESCILPCSFRPGTDPVIHWMKVEPGNTRVHSYYRARDQFDHQSERFRGRTSLFTEQISRGNASIRLTGLQLQDQGRYKCYTSTITGGNKESVINLRADAPVRHVDIEQVENSFTCRSEGIYPEPQLTWSTRPPSTVTLQIQTSVKETEQQLYEISSTLTLSDRDTVLICSLSTRSGRRSAVWYQPTPVHVSPSGTTIHCTAPNTKPPTHLVWRFNHRQIIVDQTGVDGPPRVSEQWRQQVEDVSASGSLTLHHLSSDHQGTFTCELSSEEETHFINSYVTIEEGFSGSVAGIVVGVLVVCVALGAGAGLCYFRRRQWRLQRGNLEFTRFQVCSSGADTEERRPGGSFSQSERKMSGFKSLVVLILNMWTLTTADVEVSCVLAESCILPCSFQPGTDPVIHWMQEAGETRVHSYYRARDQFDHQSERFRGRTSLFTEQISRGNASMRLTGLQLQDQGRYQCYTSIINGDKEDSFINLRADAPVRHVDIEQVENSFTCRSEGIYPEPQLTWSTRPPSTVTLQIQTSVKETEQQLYEINSTLTLSDRDTVLICSLSTRSGRRSAVWYQPSTFNLLYGTEPLLVSPYCCIFISAPTDN